MAASSSIRSKRRWIGGSPLNNADQDRIRRFLAEHDDGKLVVPHGENRAVLVNSNLFHETDRIDFKTGYENRRINVTMLFGLRQN